ncbi:hypothetical protein TNIN_395621 [Trichonephila inaurata madagascariensis]|uniref:Uncharacterized protein n=1 Tax=Trichonephila inaurata madagascariensis TaxID=2747483 RepID=A0A8X6YAK8_9ARAC|nr:hypothetical protein TNIN_395621 [Trichonephila inaurata madagascariensis]
MRYHWDRLYGLLVRSGQLELLLLLGFFPYRPILDLSAGWDGDGCTRYEGGAIHRTCLFFDGHSSYLSSRRTCTSNDLPGAFTKNPLLNETRTVKAQLSL